MKETLDWEVKVARVIVRNKGKEATKRAFLKCTGRPAADTIEVGGKMVVLRAQAEKEKDVDQQQEGFFAGLKKEEAARAVLKEKEPTQSMKDFAFRALSVEKQRPIWNSLQEDDEDMDENSEAGSGSFKECKETPLQIALSKSLEQKLKTDAASLGDQAFFLCTDLNMTEAVSIDEALMTGTWVDVGTRYTTEDEAEPTYAGFKNWDKRSRGRNVTRPDRILANKPERSCDSPATKLTRKLQKSRRQAVEIQVKMNSRKAEEIDTRRHIIQLWTKIQRTIVNNRIPCQPVCKKMIPEERDVQWFLNVTQAMIEKIDKEAAERRIQNWLSKMKRVLNRRSSTKEVSKDWKALSNFIKQGRTPPITSVLVEDQENQGEESRCRKHMLLKQVKFFSKSRRSGSQSSTDQRRQTLRSSWRDSEITANSAMHKSRTYR